MINEIELTKEQIQFLRRGPKERWAERFRLEQLEALIPEELILFGDLKFNNYSSGPLYLGTKNMQRSHHNLLSMVMADDKRAIAVVSHNAEPGYRADHHISAFDWKKRVVSVDYTPHRYPVKIESFKSIPNSTKYELVSYMPYEPLGEDLLENQRKRYEIDFEKQHFSNLDELVKAQKEGRAWVKGERISSQ
ncbi:MAG: hypothetical protein WC533_03930 [Candidatus Pacearchaeota archaeon]